MLQILNPTMLMLKSLFLPTAEQEQDRRCYGPLPKIQTGLQKKY